MNRSDLEQSWSAIDVPSGRGTLVGKTATGSAGDFEPILAIDSNGLRHLLIPATEQSEAPRNPTTKGLQITVDDLKVGDDKPRYYYDVACRDVAANQTFTVVAAEVLDALHAEPGEIKGTLEGMLDRWRWFWGMQSGGMADEVAVGLFGELWFLEYWLDPVDTQVIDAWTGPQRDRHDFKWPAASVEVKATRARTDGAATHRISTLDQLEDPDQGLFYLFSLRVSPDPIASHTLNKSIQRIRDGLEGEAEALHDFDEHLAHVGYTPLHADRYEMPLRVVAEELYRVDTDFPRLTKTSFANGVPAGVDGIGYTLDLAACADWRVATSPGAESRKLRQTL